MSKAIDSLYLWVGRFPIAFIAGSVVAAMLSTGAFLLTAFDPPRVASTEEAFVAESSRDIDGSPKAVAKRQDDSSVFVPGVYTAGEPVTLSLDANGAVITDEPAVYWIFFSGLTVIAGIGALFGAAVFRLHVIDSERMWRLDRRAYYGAAA